MVQAYAPEHSERVDGMTDHELLDLRTRAANGDRDAVDELVQLAGERGDMDELRRLADGGSYDAVDELVQLAGERGEMDELRRLADTGSRDAAAVLAELTGESDDDGLG
jgi:hypothetical protein